MKAKRQNQGKKIARLRRALRGRARIKLLGVPRLSIHRTSSHVYAQIIAPTGDRVLASASSLEKEHPEGHGGNVKSAKAVGERVAQRAIQAGVTAVAFDRSGFQYHGCIKALADAAREKGLIF